MWPSQKSLKTPKISGESVADDHLAPAQDANQESAQRHNLSKTQRAQPSLKARALRLLASREYSRAELERKLAVHAESPEALAQALDFLQAKDFINESRVIESVIHQKASKFGAKRVKQMLGTKGLAPEAIQHALNELKPTEFERARALWARKFGEIATDPKERAKQMRYLISRGFAASMVLKITGDNDLY